jgi:hypothetical protein
MRLMAEETPRMNEVLMRCAMKGAIDGSVDVRRAFCECARRFQELGGTTGAVDENIDWFIRRDLATFLSEAEAEPPNILSVLRVLADDPSPKVRHLADCCLNEKRIETHWDSLHRKAHLDLFCQDCATPALKIRYRDTLFTSGDSEQLEEFSSQNSAVTAVAFDYNHGNVSYGTESGQVVWASNTWNVPSPIVSIVHVSESLLFGAARNGVVYVFRHSCDSWIEAFRPSLGVATTDLQMIACRGSNSKPSAVFFACGAKDVFRWDPQALVLTDRVSFESPVSQMALVNERLFCALESGFIAEVDPVSCEILRSFEVCPGRRITQMGQSCTGLCAVADEKELFIWDTDVKMPEVRDLDAGVRFIPHPWLDRALEIRDDSIWLTDANGMRITDLIHESRGFRCCCFDREKPLLAIGHADGTVSVWRA